MQFVLIRTVPSVERVFTDAIGDAFEYAIVVNKKGKRVIEEFVNSYSKMYKDVYFHKTTRSMQHLATLSMRRALEELSFDEIKSDRMLSTLRSISDGPIGTDRYMFLDDSVFTNAIGFIRECGKGESAEFASRYLARKPLKCLDTASYDMSPAKIKALRDGLAEKKIWFHLDLFKDKGYKQYSVADRKFTENIILNIDGQHKRLHEVGHVEQANGHSLRFYFKNDDDRAGAIAVFKSL